MKTPRHIRERESARKVKKREENRVKLQKIKQHSYFIRTQIWEEDPANLHWHHTDPTRKTRKISHLITRSWCRIFEEISHCIVLHRDEHFALHHNHSPQRCN